MFLYKMLVARPAVEVAVATPSPTETDSQDSTTMANLETKDKVQNVADGDDIATKSEISEKLDVKHEILEEITVSEDSSKKNVEDKDEASSTELTCKNPTSSKSKVPIYETWGKLEDYDWLLSDDESAWEEFKTPEDLNSPILSKKEVKIKRLENLITAYVDEDTNTSCLKVEHTSDPKSTISVRNDQLQLEPTESANSGTLEELKQVHHLDPEDLEENLPKYPLEEGWWTHLNPKTSKKLKNSEGKKQKKYKIIQKCEENKVIRSGNQKSKISCGEVRGATHYERMLGLLESGLKSDLSLIVGKEKKCMKAHKIILSTASPVFQLLFTASKDSIVEIPTVEPKIFRQFLNFMYTGQWTENQIEAPALLKVAQLYEVPDLVQNCELILKEYTDTMADSIKKYVAFDEEEFAKGATSLGKFRQAVEHNDAKLEASAIKEICKYAYVAVELKGFLELTEEHLVKIASRDDLAVSGEIQLFKALIRWTEAEYARKRSGNEETIKPEDYRSILDKLLPHIRFEQINRKDFAREVYPMKILTTEEVIAIYISHDAQFLPRDNLVPQEPNGNLIKPRGYHFQGACILERLPTIYDGVYIHPSPYWHQVGFKSSEQVWVTSLGLNPVYYQPWPPVSYHHADIPVEIRIQDAELEEVFAYKLELVPRRLLKSDEHYHVKFNKPVKIKKSVWYTAAIRIEGNYVAANCWSTESTAYCQRPDCDPVKITFRDSIRQGPQNATTATTGQMAVMGFLLY